MSYGTFWPTVQRRISFATNFDPLAVRGFKAFKTVCTHLFVYTQFTGACICLCIMWSYLNPTAINKLLSVLMCVLNVKTNR